MDLNEILQLISSHNSTIWIVTLVVTGLIQISPIKVNPWSWLCNQIKNALMGDTLKEVKTLGGQVNSLHSELNNNIAELRTQTVDLNCQIILLGKNLDTLNSRLKQLNDQVENDEKVRQVDRVEDIRRAILEFGDYLYAHPEDGHTKERYDSVLALITKYEQYCDSHPEFENEKAVMTIKYIKNAYEECCERHSFL